MELMGGQLPLSKQTVCYGNHEKIFSSMIFQVTPPPKKTSEFPRFFLQPLTENKAIGQLKPTSSNTLNSIFYSTFWGMQCTCQRMHSVQFMVCHISCSINSMYLNNQYIFKYHVYIYNKIRCMCIYIYNTYVCYVYNMYIYVSISILCIHCIYNI